MAFLNISPMVKLTKRKGFNFFRSYYDVYNELNDKDKVAFMDSLLDRQFLGIKPTNLKGMSKFAYISQTNSIDSQVKGYEDKTGTKLTPTVGGKVTPTEQVQVQVKEKVKEKVNIKVYSKEIHDCLNNCLSYFDLHLYPKKNDTWLDTIDKLFRIDKIPLKSIEDIVKKTRQDNFWSKNFLSLTKLRKTNSDGIKYIIVFNEQIKSNEQPKNNKGNGATDEELAVMLEKKFRERSN